MKIILPQDGRYRKNLFVPLTAEVFSWYFQGKLWEIRKARGPWNKSQLYRGRGITLSRGYNGPCIFCTVWNNVIFDSLDKIFQLVPFHEVTPTAQNTEKAKCLVQKILGPANQYAAFELDLWGPDGFILLSSQAHEKKYRGKLPHHSIVPERIALFYQGKKEHPRIDIPGCESYTSGR